ncbi:hypothetical protein AMTRI_Chr05g71170 [Amborella trichopoda]
MIKQFLSKLPRKNPKPDSPTTFSSPLITEPSISGRRTSSAVFPANFDPLSSLKEAPASEKQSLLISKLNLCTLISHSSNSQPLNETDQELRHQTLIEILDFVNLGSCKFNEQVMEALCNMISAHIFRVLPPSIRSSTVFSPQSAMDIDEDEPAMDPAWPYLQIVYDLLLKFVASSNTDPKAAKKYLDHSFVFRLLELFDSEDPREREALKKILHRIYGKFMVHRPFIRKTVSNIFYRFVFETERHNGIAELLEVLGSIISGFALPLKEEHKMFLVRALIPLHKAKNIGAYLQQLSFSVIQFVEKEPKLAGTVITGLLKYWPATNSQKEVMFLGELEEVLEVTNGVEFQRIMVPLCRRIALCINSSHFQVAERALFLWNNEHIVSLIAQNRQVILTLVYQALERNTRSHWNQAVLNLTLNVRKMFSEMDEELFQMFQSNYEEEEAKVKGVEEKRRLTWERLEAAAKSGPSDPAKNTAVLVTPLIICTPLC